MSYKWFKDWADKSPKTVVLIETHEGFESFGICATVIFRLMGTVPFRPNKKEKTKEPEVLIPMRLYPTLLDKLNRCRISHLVAREDFKVYNKEYDPRFFDIFATPIRNPLKASPEDLVDRGISVDDRITVKNLETRKEYRWTLVPEAEADDTNREKSGNISVDANLGSSLVGHYVGEDVTVVNDMTDSATYRILLALDPEGHKLKKVRRVEPPAPEQPETEQPEVQQSESEAVQAPEAEAVASATYDPAVATPTDDNSSATMFQETPAEEMPAEEIPADVGAEPVEGAFFVAETEETVAETVAVEAAEENAETVWGEAFVPEAFADTVEATNEEEIPAEEVVVAEESAEAVATNGEEPVVEEAVAAETVAAETVAEEAPVDAVAATAKEPAAHAKKAERGSKKPSFFQWLFSGKAKHKAVRSKAKHLKTRKNSAAK